MYTDTSRNPITATQAVDALVHPLQRALTNLQPLPRYRYKTGVSVDAYNRLLDRYAELAHVSERALLSLRSRAMELEIENLRLRAALLKRDQ
jgi:hypothetical protein